MNNSLNFLSLNESVYWPVHALLVKLIAYWAIIQTFPGGSFLKTFTFFEFLKENVQLDPTIWDLH